MKNSTTEMEEVKVIVICLQVSPLSFTQKTFVNFFFFSSNHRSVITYGQIKINLTIYRDIDSKTNLLIIVNSIPAKNYRQKVEVPDHLPKKSANQSNDTFIVAKSAFS